MRTLPDSPSLDYLRRQAKDLLMGLRQARCSASLADAQTALARQYGFRTWPELKAEVDRRRGQAEVAEPALAEAIARRFELGRVTRPMRSLARANEVGRPWALDTEHGRWTVKQLNDWFDASNAEDDVRLQEAALEAGVVLPRPMRSASGAIVESLDGHNWRVNAWTESGPPLSAPVSAPIAAQAGALLARLHALALPTERPMEAWYAPLQNGDDWTALSARASRMGAAWSEVLQRLLPEVLELRELCVDAKSNPTILCYCGFGPDNTRVMHDGGLGLLGWEHAGAFPPTWELANALINWTVGPYGDPPNLIAAGALLDAYAAQSGRVPVLNLSSFSAAISGWLNYVYGQICIAIDPADSEERQFVERTVYHLLSHAPSRALFECLLAAVPSAH